MKGRRSIHSPGEGNAFVTTGFDLQSRLDEGIPPISDGQALAAVAYTATVAELQGWDPALVLAMLGLGESA